VSQAANISIPYGQEQIALALKADLILPPPSTPISDETGAILRALHNPIGTPPLADIVDPGDKVAIVVNDITRLARSDLMLPPILNTLNQAGVADSDIFVVFALGTHRRQTDQERQRIVGDEVSRRVRMFDHIGSDDSNLVTI
jgi:nickel-dependent lactate racemase